MPAPHWRQVPAADIADHPLSARLAACLRADSSRTTGHEGRWSIFSDRDYGLATFDARGVKRRRTHGRWGYVPSESSVPWDAGWRPPAGTDGGCIMVDATTGQRWGVWGPEFPARLLGVIPIPGVLGCGNAWLIRRPTYDRKGRVVRGEPVDMREYRGNDPMCNGAGVIPQPVTQADLDAGRIARALSAYVSADTFAAVDPRGMVVAPAGKVENATGPSAGGVRFAWEYEDEDLDGCFAHVEPRHRAGLLVICQALREFGASVDMTGPAAGIVGGDIDLPRDGLDAVVDRVRWRVLAAPTGWRFGAPVGDGPGHYDDIRY